MLSRFWNKPIVPLLLINSSMNQEKASNLLRKLQKVNYKNAKALAMVIEIDNHMPVQIDKIAEMMEEIRKQYSLKLYGFCHSNITLESYYLLSKADEIYAMQTSIFQLERGVKYFDTEEFLKKIGVQKTTFKSHPNVIGNFMDSFTSANTAKYLNTKMSEVTERIYLESITSRRQITGKQLQLEPPETMLGVQALQKGYVDRIGSYYDVLRSAYPQCQIKHIRLREKMSTRTLQWLIASPIILVLFLIKVLIKYAIIMYLWLKHKKNKSAKA